MLLVATWLIADRVFSPDLVLPARCSNGCGITTAETLEAVIDGGATHVGFVFFEKSPRHLSFEAALPRLSAQAEGA